MASQAPEEQERTFPAYFGFVWPSVTSCGAAGQPGDNLCQSMSSMSCSMSLYVSLGLNCGPSHPNKDLSSHKDGPAECFGCVIQQQEAAGVDATPGVLVGM